MLLRPPAASGRLKKHKEENPMNEAYYSGFHVHKKTVSSCVKTASGEIVQEGRFLARREVLRMWAAASTFVGSGRCKGRKPFASGIAQIPKVRG